jgi:hypothetical protein
MNVESVKKALLEAAGNPQTGTIFEIADELSRAIVKAHSPKQEERVVKSTETR